jgi:AraC-like DNA-binding protein
MIIEFTVDKPQNWLQHIANQFGVEPEKNTIFFPPHIGEGFLRHYYLGNGITLNYLHFKFYREITFSRKAGKEVPFSPVMFYINEKKYKQDVQNEIKEISSNSPNGIFWPSSQISSVWQLPVNEWLSNITLTVNHNWLLNSCDSNTGRYIHQLLSSGKPFYIFEEITPQMHYIISEIVDIIDNRSHVAVSSLLLESKTSELLALFIEKIIERPLNENIARLNSSDVKKLFLVKEILLDNIADTPQIKDLAERIGFSDSKLQKTFRQVFGKSIYQYALHEKMLMAQQMLKTRKYSVSEVGYALGYSNLSHFGRAFKKQFGTNPKSYTLHSGNP